MENDRVDPMIIYGPGRCIDCGGQLTVIDMETSFMPLSPSGKPISEETMVKCEGVCMLCGKKYPMIRYGTSYIHDNEFTRFVEDFNNQKRIEYTTRKMEELKPTKDNPFCINMERQN